jgi:hypothetical protein
MSQQFIDGLFVSSMIFFNILCILGIITSIVLIWAIFAIKKSSTNTLEKIEEATESINTSVQEFTSNVGAIIRPRTQKSWVDVVLQMIKK